MRLASCGRWLAHSARNSAWISSGNWLKTNGSMPSGHHRSLSMATTGDRHWLPLPLQIISCPDRPGRTDSDGSDSAEGLRRAFLAAGAESVLPVPSNKTFWSLRPPQIESQGNQRWSTFFRGRNIYRSSSSPDWPQHKGNRWTRCQPESLRSEFLFAHWRQFFKIRKFFFIRNSYTSTRASCFDCSASSGGTEP